jgi:hypothetical protein
MYDGRDYSSYARVSVTAAASIQVFASAASTRYRVTGGMIGWVNASAGGTINLMEGSTSVYRFGVDATAGHWEMPREMVIEASDANMSFRLNTDMAGTVTAVFIGYVAGYS